MAKWIASFGQSMGETAGGGLLSGLGNTLFGGIQARRNWKYKKKEMALQQQYTLDQMNRQFDYDQQAWNAENEYNKPTAVASRYRDAGINPIAALSGGSAGLAGSMQTPSASGMPSGGSYGSDAAPDYGVLSEIANRAKLADAEVALKDAQRRNVDQDTISKSNQNSVWDNVREGILAGVNEAKYNADKAKYDADISKVASAFAEANALMDLSAKRKAYDIAVRQLDNLVKDGIIKDETAKEIRARIPVYGTQAAVNTSQVGVNTTQAALNKAEKGVAEAREENLKSDTELKEEQQRLVRSQKGLTDKKVEQVDAEIERIGRLNNKTDWEIRLAKQEFWFNFAKFPMDMQESASRIVGNVAKSIFFLR